jgi:hypothetical protein
MTSKSVLIGLHNRTPEDHADCKLIAVVTGYRVVEVEDLPRMLEQIGKRQFDAYYMDANLGKSGSLDINPARQVYELVKSRVEKREARFLAVSGNPLAVRLAQATGIPAGSTDLYTFLKS